MGKRDDEFHGEPCRISQFHRFGEHHHWWIQLPSLNTYDWFGIAILLSAPQRRRQDAQLLSSYRWNRQNRVVDQELTQGEDWTKRGYYENLRSWWPHHLNINEYAEVSLVNIAAHRLSNWVRLKWYYLDIPRAVSIAFCTPAVYVLQRFRAADAI